VNLGSKIALIGWSLVAVRAIWPRIPAKVRPWVIAGVSLFIIALFSWIILTLGHLANS
jgi:hypothetical protein